MFQDDALFPHRDVAPNVAFGLRMQGMAEARTRGRGSTELLALVGLEGRERRTVELTVGRRAQAGRTGPGARAGTAACSCSTSRSAPSTVRCTTGWSTS